MTCSGIWRRVGLVRADVSKKRFASIFRVERINELGMTINNNNNSKKNLVGVNRRENKGNQFLMVMPYRGEKGQY
jgi:hypothetical protein